MLGARIFVAMVFLGLAASFILPTYTLYTEFGAEDGFALAATYSHIFLFFPTIGIVALLAFYTPAAVFIDFYWRHVPYGEIRFIGGMMLVLVLSVFVAGKISNNNMFAKFIMQLSTAQPGDKYVPTLWELSPQTYFGETGEPAGCVTSDELCIRQPLRRSLHILRKVSQSRTGLTAFSRNCARDPLLEEPPESRLLRYCFPLLRKVDGPTCCLAQRRFSKAMSHMFRNEKQHSKTREIHARMLPFKTFFMLIILAIGLLLARWRQQLDHHYPKQMPALEHGVLIGAGAMLFWPAANQAFLQSMGSLYGPYSNSAYQNQFGPFFSAAFGLWALLLLFFFVRKVERDVELWVKAAGAITSMVAVVKYNIIIDIVVRFLGSGAYQATFLAVSAFGILVYISSFFWPRNKRTAAGVEEEEELK